MGGASRAVTGLLRNEVYEFVRKAVQSRQPISAVYRQRRRLLCPHRLGWNKDGQPRVLCYQYGGESESGLKPVGSPDNWRCIALDKLSQVQPADGEWRTAANHSRPSSCIAEPDVDAEDYPDPGLRQEQ